MKTYYVDFARDDTSEERRYKSEVGIDLLYSDVQKIRAETFENSQIDEIVQWGFNDSTKERNLVDTDLYKEKKSWFDKHNHGYYVWKPYIIYDLIKSVEDGDVVVFWDNVPLYPKFKYSFRPFLDHFNKNYDMIVGLEQYGLKHREWTKPECFEVMGCTSEKYLRRRKQIQVTWSVWKKTPKTLKVLKEWLDWCMKEDVVAHDVNANDSNGKKYLYHRWEQSILTNIAIKYNCTAIASRGSGVRLNSWFGKNFNKIAKQYDKCRFISL